VSDQKVWLNHLDRYIEEEMTAAARREMFEAKKKELLKRLRIAASWSEQDVKEVVNATMRLEVKDKASLMNFKEFCAAWKKNH
jgi:hypothetical protein